MSDQGSERDDRPQDERVELIDFAGLPCRKSAQELFAHYMPMAFFEAVMVMSDWAAIGEQAQRTGQMPVEGEITTPHRSIHWTVPPDGIVIVTVTRLQEPRTYSLLWRAGRNADRYSAYVHDFWLGGAGQRPLDGQGGGNR